MGQPERQVDVVRLGRTNYASVHELQLELRERRIAGQVPDTLLLTEHEPVITLGKSHPVPSLRVAAGAIEAAGIAIVQTERGGDITYHGPGQLVAYGIIDLRAWRMGVVDYVAGLEQAALRTLAYWGVNGGLKPGARGVWVGDRKIASIGVHVRRWVTMHGIAINVAPNFEQWQMIEPCGMAGVEMTGIAREAGCDIAVAQAEDVFLQAFAGVFACRFNVRSQEGAA